MGDALLALSVFFLSLSSLWDAYDTQKKLDRLMKEIDATDDSLDALWDEVEALKAKQANTTN